MAVDHEVTIYYFEKLNPMSNDMNGSLSLPPHTERLRTIEALGMVLVSEWVGLRQDPRDVRGQVQLWNRINGIGIVMGIEVSRCDDVSLKMPEVSPREGSW